MTLKDLKKCVDALVKEGYGKCELLMDNDPDEEFDIELIERTGEEDGIDDYIGVRTNDNH